MGTRGGCGDSENLGIAFRLRHICVVGTSAHYVSHQAAVSSTIKWVGQCSLLGLVKKKVR